LDPFPFASTTSFLEAGMYACPLVSYSPFSDERAVFGADSPELSGVIVKAQHLDAYTSKLLTLIRGRVERAVIGESTRSRILEAHLGKTWNDQLESAYSAAATITPAALGSKKDLPSTSSVDVRLVCVSANSGTSRDIAEILREDVGLLPLSQRLKSWSFQPNRRLSSLFRFVFLEWLRQSRRGWMLWKRRKISDETVVA